MTKDTAIEIKQIGEHLELYVHRKELIKWQEKNKELTND